MSEMELLNEPSKRDMSIGMMSSREFSTAVSFYFYALIGSIGQDKRQEHKKKEKYLLSSYERIKATTTRNLTDEKNNSNYKVT